MLVTRSIKLYYYVYGYPGCFTECMRVNGENVKRNIYTVLLYARRWWNYIGCKGQLMESGCAPVHSSVMVSAGLNLMKLLLFHFVPVLLLADAPLRAIV